MAASDLEVLEQELAYLARALEAIQRKRRYPLDRALYLLLRLLGREGPQPVAAIAEALLLDASTVTRQVDALAGQGLVERIRNPGDRRSILVEVTEAGREMAATMRDMRLGRIALLFGEWDIEARGEFAEGLARLNATLRRSILED